MHLNCDRLLLISFSFFLLFTAYLVAQGLAGKVLNELGYGDFGFYSLGLLYFVFGMACFVSTPIVKKCGERSSLFFASLGYGLFVSSFILASMPLEYPDLKGKWYLNENFIKFMVMFGASACGFGAAVLWTANGRYISTCASNKNKGLFNAVFWGIMQISSIICYIAAALILAKFNYVPFYITMTVVSILASLFFLLLCKPVA